MDMNPTTHSAARPLVRGVACLSLGLSVLTLGGCRGERTDEPPRQFFPDMDDSPKFKNQGASEFFKDGRMMRPRVPGTIAFGETMRPDDAERWRFAKDTPEIFTGIDPAAAPPKEGAPLGAAGQPGVSYVAFMPRAVLERVGAQAAARNQAQGEGQTMAALIARGQERFNIYCSACHGYNGEGGNPGNFTGGLVGRRWGYPVPSLHDAKYKDRSQQSGQDGYIFHVIRNGVPDADPAKPHKMPPYRDKVNEADAWAIVAYIRVLQTSWQEDLKNLPPELRQKLESTRPTLPPAGGSPQPGPTSDARPSTGSTPAGAGDAGDTGAHGTRVSVTGEGSKEVGQ